jgi:hypothetical protein
MIAINGQPDTERFCEREDQVERGRIIFRHDRRFLCARRPSEPSDLVINRHASDDVAQPFAETLASGTVKISADGGADREAAERPET